MDGRSQFIGKAFGGGAHISAKALTSPVLETTNLFEEVDTAESSVGRGWSGSLLAPVIEAAMHDARHALRPLCRRKGRAPARSKFRAKNQLHDATTGILDSCGDGVNEPRLALIAIPRERTPARPGSRAGPRLGPPVSMLIYWAGVASMV